MRLQHPNTKANKIQGLPMTSLIDVVFLLLIYFIVTTQISQPESELAAALQQESRGAAKSDFQPQNLRVTDEPDAPFQVGARRLPDQVALTQLLRALPKESGIFIRVSDSARISDAAAAWQAARDAGFRRVTYVPSR